MEYQEIIELGKQLNRIEVPTIDSNVNFWMIRSKGGYFYDEYISNEFMALGWNFIDSSTSLNKDTLEILKQGIKERYGDKRPMLAINKCKRFISELKQGDYVLIPNVGSSEITIALVGEYYEEASLDYIKEITDIRKIDNGECEIRSIACPYKKRRKIQILLKVSSKRIGYKLLRAISTYHGLSEMNEYAEDILNCIYNCYEYKNNIMYTINIAKKERIKPRELSKLFWGVTESFCNIIDEEAVSVSVNLNSPGRMTVRLEAAYKKLKKGAIPLVAVYLFAFGGSGFGFEFPGLVDHVINAIKEMRMMDIEVEKAKEDLKGEQLDNYMKILEIMESVKAGEIDIEKVETDLKTIQEMSDVLCFESNEKFAMYDEDNDLSEGNNSVQDGE